MIKEKVKPPGVWDSRFQDIPKLSDSSNSDMKIHPRGNLPKKYLQVLFSFSVLFKVLRQKKTTYMNFSKVCRIRIKIYSQSSIEPKYGVFYCNNKVRVHTLSLFCLLEKVITWRFFVVVENLTHTNQNIHSTLYCDKIWCILLQYDGNYVIILVS